METLRAELAEMAADLKSQQAACRRWETTAQHLAHMLPPELGISGKKVAAGGGDDEEEEEYFNLLDFAAAASPASIRRKSPSLSHGSKS
jgi:hypothetical protein